MKRIYTYILMIVCAMMFAGCQKDFSGVFTVDIEGYQGGDGKVYINTDRFACWHSGDDVVINGENCKVVFGETGSEATITMTQGADAENFTAVYPAAYATSVTGGRCAFRLPELQNYEQDAQGRQVVKAPMMAYTTKTDNKLTFRNVGSVLAVKVGQVANGNERRVRRIEVSDLNDGKLWGEATCSWENGVPKLGTLSNGGSKVALNIPYDLGMVNGERTFYVALPPVENAQLQVKVIYEDNTNSKAFKYYSKTSPAGITVERNMILPVTMDGNVVDYKLRGSGTEEDPYLIESELDFDVLRAQSQTDLYKGKCFRQEVDLVVPNSVNYKGIDFEGVYDGNGKTITLGAVDKPSESGIFYVVESNENARTVIKNLNAQVVIEIDSDKKNTIVGGIVNTISGTVDISNCKVMGSIVGDTCGGIVGYFSGGALSIKNCVNEGRIKFDMVHYSCAGIGGIIGLCSGEVGGTLIVENCINKGNVRDYNKQGDFKMGGILGRIVGNSKVGCTNFDAKIINCCNLGNIDGTLHSYSMVGGIVGQMLYGGNVIIDRCINRGEIKGIARVGGLCGDGSNEKPLLISNSMNWGSVTGSGYVGGLFGYTGYNGVSISNSCNMGDVKCEDSNESLGIGGLIGYASECANGRLKLENVYVGGVVSRKKSTSSEYEMLNDRYLVDKFYFKKGESATTLIPTNVYIPEGGKSSNDDNSTIDDTLVKRYDANRNVVGTSPATLLVDVLNGHMVTLPEGISKEPWVEIGNRVMLRYGLLMEPSMPLPGTGNQNEQYGDMGNEVWE